MLVAVSKGVECSVNTKLSILQFEILLLWLQLLLFRQRKNEHVVAAMAETWTFLIHHQDNQSSTIRNRVLVGVDNVQMSMWLPH